MGNLMFFNSKLQVLVMMLLTVGRSYSFIMAHSQDIEMQRRHYFAVEVNKVNMMSNPVFRPDIPINHQFLVLEDPEKNFDEFDIGDDIPLIWYAIVPEKYTAKIINLNLYFNTQKKTGKGIENPLVLPDERFSFRKHIVYTPKNGDELRDLEIILKFAFHGMDISRYQTFRRNQGSTIDEKKMYLNSINDEDLIDEYEGQNDEEKRRNWEEHVLQARDEYEAEVSYVYTDIMIWLLKNAKPNMNLVGSYPFLSEYIYGKDPELRTYFHTRTLNVKTDDVESKGIDRQYDVLTLRCWFEFSLEFPGLLEINYIKQNQETGRLDGDQAKYNAFMDSLAQSLDRRQLIL